MRNRERIREYTREGLLENIGVDITLAHGHFFMAYHNLKVMGALNACEHNPPHEWEKCPDWVIVSGYYAMYHSALALLALKGWKSRDHDATISMLGNLYLFKDGALSIADINKISEAKKFRDSLEKLKEAKLIRRDASYGVDLAKLDDGVDFIVSNAKPFVDSMYKIAGDELGYELLSRV